jgi:membrane peptidoglycan carboxypeptidase
MQTSTARRQRERRNGAARRSGGTNAGRGIAIALPLILFGSFLVLGSMGFAAAVGAYSSFSQGLPDPKALLENITFNQETTIYDRTAKVQLATFATEKRQVVEFDQIPGILVDATTSIEDKSFWENAGFDPLGIARAAISSTGGASTITQQLVRARLLPESAFAGSKYERKIKEIIQSIRLTQEYPGEEGKKRIMALYLNQNFYGNNSYGVKAAARSYFGVTDLSKLTLAQAAILAAIPQSPSEYDLVANAVEQEAADGKTTLVVPPEAPIVQRRNTVLELMKTRSVLSGDRYTEADYEKAKEEPVVLAPQTAPRWRAPHFVWEVRRELAKILCGPDAGQECPQIDTGGYKVVTTLDWKMQQSAEKWSNAAGRGPVQKKPASYYKALKVPYRDWLKNLEGKGVNNAALTAIDYRTGQVLAHTGSAGYYLSGKSKKFQPQFDVMADGWRQPGSAFKPINYITGIEDGTLTAASMFMDVVTDFGGGWTPTDADRMERGPLRLRQALQVSLNIPAIKAAAYNGVDHVLQTARRFGIRFQDGVDPGLSVAIGTAEIHMDDLASAYGAIANGGVLVPRTTILKITDPQGNTIWPIPGAKTKTTKVVSPQAAYIMTDILASNTDPEKNPFWSARKLVNAAGTRRPAALKTGTTDSTIDLTAGGFVAPPKDSKKPAIVTVAWMGNSDNSAPPEGVVALESAASLWQEFMNEVTKSLPLADFVEPDGIVRAKVDAWSGLRPGPGTTRTVNEIFIDGTVPTKVDDTKTELEIDSATGDLWQEGCTGPMEKKTFLDLSNVESAFPQWRPFNLGWIKRAEKGAGVRGGPERTPTSYFYQTGGWMPFGSSWGAEMAPTKTCEPVPQATYDPATDPNSPYYDPLLDPNVPSQQFPWDTPPPGAAPPAP